MAEVESGPNYWDPSVMGPALTPAEKALRENFVNEYLLDYDPVAACIRIGLMQRVALSYSFTLMNEPFVLNLIKERQATIPEKKNEKSEEQRLQSLLWELAYYKGPGASHGARVAAASKLCNIKGMDGATKIKSEVTHRGGVMVVPGIASVEDWETEAATSQGKLISEARH